MTVGQFPAYPLAPAFDRDRDGAPETVCAAYMRGAQYAKTFVVVRLAGGTNQIAGIVRVGVAQLRRSSVYVVWRDEDRDGLEELVVRAAVFQPAPKGGPTLGSAETLAVLAWNHPGGVLRPVQLPDDGSVIAWTPADGQPHGIPVTAVVDEVCDELLPVPEGFGAVTQPASAPVTLPATQPQSP